VKQLYGSLTPAYNRDYRSGVEALADWNAGKDFRINCPEGSTYCSIRDTDGYQPGHSLQLRYQRKTMVGVIAKQADGTYTGIFHDEDEES
jgi:hypothetical protein